MDYIIERLRAIADGLESGRYQTSSVDITNELVDITSAGGFGYPADTEVRYTPSGETTLSITYYRTLIPEPVGKDYY